MYCIFVKLNGCAQMERIDKEEIQAFAQELNQVAIGLGLVEWPHIPHVFTYLLHSDHIESVDVCLQALEGIHRFLKKKKDDLYGYSVFVSVFENETQVNMGPWQYAVTEDNCLWLDSTLLEVFKDFIQLEPCGKLQKITKIRFSQKLYPSIKSGVYDFAKVQKTLQTAIVSGKGQVVQIISPLGYGGYEILYRLYKKNTAHIIENKLPFFCLQSEGSYYCEYRPFLRLIQPVMIDAMEESYVHSKNFITQHLFKWLAVYRQNQTISPVAIKEDLISFFKLYLAVYARTMANSFPVIVIEDCQKFGSDGIKLIKEIVEIALTESLVVVYINENSEQNLLNKHPDYEITLSNKNARHLLSKHTSFSSSYLNNANPTAILLFYWTTKVNEHNYSGDFSLSSALFDLAKNCDPLICRIIYLISVADGMVPYEWIVDAVVQEQYWRAFIVQRCKVFVELGLIRNLHQCPHLVVKSLGDMISSHMEESKKDLEVKLAKTILEKSSYNPIIDKGFLFKLLERLGMVSEALDILQRLLAECLNHHSHHLISWLNYKYFRQTELQDAERIRLQNILDTYDFAYQLWQMDAKKLTKLCDKANALTRFHPANADIVSIWLLLYVQSCYVAIGNPTGAPVEIKEIVNQFQIRQDKEGECRAILEMSHIEFLNKRFRMALDYSQLAYQMAQQLNCADLMVLCIKLVALQEFLRGNIEQTFKMIDEGIECSMAHRYLRKELFFRFFRVRILFECGQYQESLFQLKKIEQLSTIYGYTHTMETITCWQGRCLSHLSRLDEAVHLLQRINNCESYYYLAEAYFVAGRTNDALTAAQHAVRYTSLEQQIVPVLDTEYWLHGYSLVEGYIDKTHFGYAILGKLAQSFYYYVLGLTGERQNALLLLEEICEAEQDHMQNMYAYLYFYYYAQLCDEPERKRMAHGRAVRLFNQYFSQNASMQTRKMIEKGYFASKMLKEKPVEKDLR